MLINFTQRLTKSLLTKKSLSLVRFSSKEVGKYPKHWFRNLIRDLKNGKEPYPLIHPKAIYIITPLLFVVVTWVLPNVLVKEVFPSEKRFRNV